MTLGRPSVDGRPLDVDLSTWQGSGGINGTPPRLRYLVTGDDVARLRAPQPTDDRAVPVAATRGVADAAGPGGVVALSVGGGTVDGRIVAALRRLPTVEGEAVLADERTVAIALTAAAPGAASVDEVWLDAPAREAAVVQRRLRRPPFDVLEQTSYRGVLGKLRGEPLARGTLLTLAGAALVALVLAAAGLLLGVVSDLRDERGELFDLEAQGAEPSTLRRHLRLRSAYVALFGAAAGLATGALLAALIVSLVTLTAAAEAATEPPLRLAVDWPVLALALVAFGVVAGGAVAVATRSAFRADVAGRLAESGT
jgi:hypothetical protein